MTSFLEEMLGGGEAADRIRELWNVRPRSPSFLSSLLLVLSFSPAEPSLYLSFSSDASESRSTQEYEAGQTPEAKFVKDLDRLELCLQTVEYERSTFNFTSQLQHCFSSFFPSSPSSSLFPLSLAFRRVAS